MTTTIHVINFGPDPVRVSKVGHHPNGTAVQEEHGDVLYPMQSSDFNVWGNQSIIVDEVETEVELEENEDGS